MSMFIIYLLKVILIQGLFFIMYWLFFRNTTIHTLNRVFLLLSIGLSFVIPFIHLPVFQSQVVEVVQENPVIIWFRNPSIGNEFILTPIGDARSFSIGTLIPWSYGIITLILLVRSIFYLVALNKLKNNSEPIQKEWFKLFKTLQMRPFSFFKNVFIPDSLFGSKAFDKVLAHECVHVRRFHSLDRLILDFVVSLFWFNPFIYWYRNALIEIHEYEADEGVLKQYNDPIDYQEVLYSQLQTPQYSGLVSHFNFQMIKKRIVMMNKQKKRTGWVYGLILPMTLVMIFAFSSKEAMKPIEEAGKEISSFIGPMEGVKSYTESWFQLNNEPSILPLKKDENFRMTSAFGMRTHPIEKKEKMHNGVDFACKIGTRVIATANGTVIETKNYPKGYGMRIVLDHGNGFKTFYAQLSEFKVSEGDMVEKGQVIALSGNSGASTGPHLHYEVMKGDKRVDPVKYIKNYAFSIKEAKLPKKVEVKEHHHLELDESEAVKEELKKREQELSLREEALRIREMEFALANQQIAFERIKQAEEGQNWTYEELKKTEQELFLKEQELKARANELALASQQMAFEHKEQAKEMQVRASAERERAMDEKERLNEEVVIKSLIERADNPMYVLDGQQVDQVFGSFNPEDIKSIEVVKGHKATEEYGENGRNGVVVIKTKDSKDKNKSKQKGKTKNKNKG